MTDQEKKKITQRTELDVYQKAFAAAMRIFELSKSFPAMLVSMRNHPEDWCDG